MNETTRALLTSGLTLGGGIVTFVAGQIFIKLMDAAIELRSIIGEIDGDLTLYPLERSVASEDERYRIFRRHGARLHAAAWKVVGYSYFESLFRLPPREDVLKAAKELLGLALESLDSGNVGYSLQKAQDARDEVRTLLRIKSPYSEH